jgi:hypothetical protein
VLQAANKTVLSGERLILLNMLARATVSVRAVILLSSHGFGGDALSVMRTAVELDIDLAYILAQDTDARLQRFYEYDFVETYRLLKRVESLVSTERMQTAKELFDSVELNFRNKKGHAVSWTGVTIRQRAEVVGRKSTYDKAYALGSISSHSGMSTLKHSVSSNGEEISLHTRPRGATGAPLYFASIALLRLSESISTYLNLDVKSDIEKMRSMVEDWLPSTTGSP